MSRAILEFDLPEEKDSFTLASDGSKFYFCLWNLDQHLRSVIKYGKDSEKIKEFAQSLRDIIHEKVDLDCVG